MKMTMIVFGWFVCCFLSSFNARADSFSLIKGKESLKLQVALSEEAVVHSAVELFCSDMQQVSGVRPELLDTLHNQIVIVGTIDKNPFISQLINNGSLSLEKIIGQWEAFQIQVVKKEGQNYLIVAGSDSRGTAYGVLELSRIIGVAPWVWWADATPEKKNSLNIPADYCNIQQPSVQYRGIFLNDEDWGLMPWSSKNFEQTSNKGQIGPKTYAKIFELLLRLRANSIWPAMHEKTVPFYLTEGNKEMARKYGIVVGTSHCEPLMRNSAGEWDRKKYGDYNFLTNKEIMLNYWTERLLELKNEENIYTLGLRGVHDGKMVGVTTLEEQTAVFNKVLIEQRNLLSKLIDRDLSRLPQVIVPYKEVLQIYNNGLTVPEEVTLMWCDDNYGYITRLSNSEEQKRKGGAGIYYHISYWGRPHDYLWLSTTQPALIYTEMKRAWNYGARKMWILNVGDIKPAEYETEFFMDLAWNIESIDNEQIYSHLQKWMEREFGAKHAIDLMRIKNEYYRLANIRRPEFMGWSRVEEDAIIKGGKTPTQDTEFKIYADVDELEMRIADYNKIATTVNAIETQIPESKKAAYFQLVYYPVVSAAEMNKKFLYAQKARFYARNGNSQANEYRDKSIGAYHTIASLTYAYNQDLQNGKWEGMMDMKPRDLPVFQLPELPERMNTSCKNPILLPLKKKIIHLNAADFSDSKGNVQKIEGLGHSMEAVTVPFEKNTYLIYSIVADAPGDIIIRTAVIPTHPVNGGKLRYAVRVDKEEEQVVDFSVSFRSELWKENVLRNQSVTKTRHRVKKAGKHIIKVRALDPGVILDELIIEFVKK